MVGGWWDGVGEEDGGGGDGEHTPGHRADAAVQDHWH